MRLLLDTHIFIWWADQPEKLSPAALSALEDEANELLLSVASVWEMQIKIQLGKLKLSLPLKDLIKNQQETNDLTVSPVALTHVLALDALPFHHKDPFDRLLIAQSVEEDLTLITADSTKILRTHISLKLNGTNVSHCRLKIPVAHQSHYC
jgi:PIN domain nuclease of toxin-antitoxin system